MASEPMRRLRRFEELPTPGGRELTRQLQALEGNAVSAASLLDDRTLKRFPFLSRGERSNDRLLAPGQAIGLSDSVARVGLTTPRAADAGRLTAIYRGPSAMGPLEVFGSGLGDDEGSAVLIGSGAFLFLNDGERYHRVSERDVFDVTLFGAVPNVPTRATRNVRAIKRAIKAAENAGGGVVYFPGNSSTWYAIDGQLPVVGSHVKLYAPGLARLKLTAAVPIVIPVGNIDTGARLTQSNTLASDSLAGSQTVVLSAGKGANITEGSWIVIWSEGVVPEHDAAVQNWRMEAVNVSDVTTDTLTLSAPLRFDYLTSDSAEVYVVDWVEGFEIDGLGFDCNEQTCPVFCQMSWCLQPVARNVSGKGLGQRLIRFQACLGHLAWNIRQENGLSFGFTPTSGFAYVTGEQGWCQGGRIGEVYADRCRHGYTTGATWTTNSAITTTTFTGTNLYGVGVPMDTIVGPGTHRNARGAGWDTHEVGMDITFMSLKTLGSQGVGFQVRSVRTRLVGDCFARDCVGAAFQIGSDAQYTIIESFDFENTNTGTDVASSTDWTVLSPIRDNSLTTVHGEPKVNTVDNGSFELWRRGTSFSATGATCNRWRLEVGAGETCNVQQRPLTATDPGTGRWFLRFTRSVTGSGASRLEHYIDDVRTHAGKRVTLSFWSRDDIDGSDLDVSFTQYFGTGGSPSADVVTSAGTRRLDGSWKLHHFTLDLPSLSGKTVGTNEDSHLLLKIELPTANGNQLFDLKDVQLSELRRPADYVPESPGELAERCQRWWETSYVDGQAPGSASSKGNIVAQSPTGGDANSWGRTVFFATRKGREPTITLYAPGTGTSNKIRNTTAGTDIDGTVSNTGQGSFHVRPSSSAAVAANDIVTGSWVASVGNFE